MKFLKSLFVRRQVVNEIRAALADFDRTKSAVLQAGETFAQVLSKRDDALDRLIKAARKL